jgi:putative endonuclease
MCNAPTYVSFAPKSLIDIFWTCQLFSFWRIKSGALVAVTVPSPLSAASVADWMVPAFDTFRVTPPPIAKRSRCHEHRTGLLRGFTKQYGLRRLVYFERHDDIRAAIQREKTIKHWPRAWKVRLIHRSNPEWQDLFETLI